MTRIGIIGSGFGGLAAAAELKRGGHENLVIFERGTDVGGVWRDNTYPGAACDVPSPYYSFSWARNPRWPRRFSTQPAILEYLRRVAAEHDLTRHIRFGTEVLAASFTGRHWDLTTSGGGEQVDVLISAAGQLSQPAWPAIKGRELFDGPSFHSAQWDHTIDLREMRIAVIGTGASAVQFVPQIQPHASRLTLFQRSAPYVIPKPDARFTAGHQALFTHVPAAQRAERAVWFGVTETLAAAFLHAPALARAVTEVSRAHMRWQTRSRPGLFEKVWPDYPVGCKRVLFSSDYLPALTQPNVDVVTSSISRITPRGVTTADGVEHDVDVIIFGTGFAAQEPLAPLRITGAGGRDLRDLWRDGARAYKGIAAAGFPNLFFMYGPNTNVGSGSVVFMHECQATYIRQAVDHITSSGPIAVRAEVEETWDRELQRKLAGSVWTKCASWYRNESGRISTNWPGLAVTYKRETAAFDPTAYATVTAADLSAAAAVT